MENIEVLGRRDGWESSEADYPMTLVVGIVGCKWDSLPWAAQMSINPICAVRNIKELEAELDQIKNDKDSLAVTLNDYKLALNNADKKIDQKELKSSGLVLELKRMEQEQMNIPAEKH